MLPGVDGFEICKRVRKVKNTPIYGSDALLAGGPNLAAVVLDDFFDNRQADAAAALVYKA